MQTFRFLDFPVYKEAKVLYLEIVKLIEKISDFSLRDQIKRAALSIILNIAEGSAKKSDREFAHFLEIAIGSVNEVVACLDVMKERKLLSNEKFLDLSNKFEGVAKQIGGFIKKLHS